MNQGTEKSLLSEQEATSNGIITDQRALLNSRHWARKLKLFTSKAAASALLGNTRSRFRGRGMEFEEVRRYQPGDDIRTIDWKVTARANGTYTKLFREERERPCHIMLDQRSTMFFGSSGRFKSVLAAELGCALAWASLAAGDRVGGQIFGNTSELDVKARNSRRAVMSLIHHSHTLNSQLLTRAKNKHTPKLGLADYFNECSRVVKPGSAVFVISDFYDISEQAIKVLTKIARHNDVTLIHVIDPIERSLPALGQLPISDGEQTINVALDSKINLAFERSFIEREQLIAKAATSSGSHLLTVDTNTTAKQALTRAYRG